MEKKILITLLLLGMMTDDVYAQFIWGEVSPEVYKVYNAQYIDSSLYVTGAFTGHIAHVKSDLFYQEDTIPGSALDAVYDLQKSHDTLYAGSEVAGYILSKLLDSMWVPTGVSVEGPSVYHPAIYDLDTLANGDLLATGDFSVPYRCAFRYNGSDLDSLHGLTIPGYSVYSCIIGDRVYISYGTIPAISGNLLVWNQVTESPEPLAETIPANYHINSMETDGKYLYVSILTMATGYDEIWRYDGQHWEFVGITDVAGATTGFLFHNGVGYVTGGFQSINGIPIEAIAAFDTSTLTFTGLDFPGNMIYDALFVNDTLYVSGSGIYFYYLSTGIPDKSQGATLYPNPAHNYLVVDYSSELQADYVPILNMLGQQIQVPFRRNDEEIVIDIRDLPQGYYVAQLPKGAFRFEKLSP